MVNFLSETAALQPNVSANRKGHSTTTTLLAIRDHILKAMNRGEVTISIIADFSRASDAVAYETVRCKFHKLGFFKSSLYWIVSYLTDRMQYVDIDDHSSERITVSFGVPQGSILGPVLSCTSTI